MDVESDSLDEKPTLSDDQNIKTEPGEGKIKLERPDTLNKDDVEKENKEGLGVKVKRKGRRGRSSGSLTMKGDKITSFTTERGITYSPNDHVYIENNRQNNAYFICAIQDFNVVKRDTLVVRVKWYYRVTEVPDCVYQHLVQDRYTQKIESDHPLANPAVRSRELFCSEATDTYPVTALRGKCRVVHCNSLEAARVFKPAADTFYCILGYNPETKRLATTQGQIRVGSMYQARMPECKPNVPPSEMPERSDALETFHWQPKGVLDGDLMMYLRAARSVAAFAGMCDGGSTEDGCQAAQMDDTTMNAMHMLHKYEYDTGKALQALVKAPALRTIDKKWNEEDTKKFVKGLRVYGKNFFKIRKELLPLKDTGELVEYYYFWKKTPAAAANRPHRRHRRHGVKRATTRSQRPASSEFLDLSSASDSENDSEDSDGLTGYRCQNCLVTVSKDWSNAGKPNPRLCTKCRIFFKKYGVDRPVNSPGDSPYFQPVRDGDINGTHNMLTRQNRNSTDSKENKKKGTNSVSSLDNLDSPTSDSKKSLVPSSPSALSTSSNCSTDREKKKRRSSESSDKEKKRHHPASDSDDKFSKRKRGGPSDSESLSDSSISGAEETQNEADETNQDELTSSSPPTSPSPVESDKEKLPAPIPVEATISGDKLAELPRPEPQHPSPNRQPIESSPLLSPTGIQTQLPSVSSQIPQGFVPLPPLPAFAFRPQYPPPPSLYPQPPFPETVSSNQKQSEADDTQSTSAAVSPPGDNSESGETTVISVPKVKEEVVTPPRSPEKVFIKQEPEDSFMLNTSQNVASAKSNMDSFAATKEMGPIVTPKLEPGLNNPYPSANEFPSGSNKIQTESTLTSQAEVLGHTEHSESQGEKVEGQESERSEVEVMEDSDSDREGTLTPGPVPTPCNKEVLRSKTAIFIKLLNRGEHNSCSRCDLMFKPLPDSKLAKKREDREKKPVSASSTPAKEEPKRKTESPRPSSTSDAQVVSNVPSSHHIHADRVTPRSYPDTPALRQLSEYAKPHTLGMYQDTFAQCRQDPRSMPGYLGYPFMDPIRMAAMYPPNSRERLELELERDKRERDARERELREHELRSLEMREKLKAEMEMKPPGLERLLPPGANPLDPHWLEIQRRYGPHMLPGGSGSSHLPGIYPPTSIASDLMARERERLERLDMLQSEQMTSRMIYQIYTQRLTHEQHIYMQRVSNELIMRAGSMAGAGGAASTASPFCNKHERPGGVESSPSHLVYQFSRADPMSGVNGASNQTPPGSLPSLPVGVPPHILAAGREQELLQSDLYRRAYSDPALAQQLQAHHEALQRMAMDRERFGSGLPPPH
ncbi:arginine-glutamic acid dipeptide repeats protein-like isoform X3 [Mercenaria mercenaria]|uniref:arginine-glutamic acid dipeptide repeats protein-like isoform X3 n=1 Tax=Mercenaria mercenaria TaxID=6596 RepID=UPI00234E87E3|nr:arginine-glutamic acid dipeptide repeats protein-like isoform X3 [Mercenaria mercenaria]